MTTATNRGKSKQTKTTSKVTHLLATIRIIRLHTIDDALEGFLSLASSEPEKGRGSTTGGSR